MPATFQSRKDIPTLEKINTISTMSNTRLADMNRGAKIFQTIKCRRKCVAKNMVESVMQLIASTNMSDAVVTSTSRGESDRPSPDCPESLRAESGTGLRHKMKTGIHSATTMKDPNVLPMTSNGEMGYTIDRDTKNAKSHCMNGNPIW